MICRFIKVGNCIICASPEQSGNGFPQNWTEYSLMYSHTSIELKTVEYSISIFWLKVDNKIDET